jgi:hypothetical protein
MAPSTTDERIGRLSAASARRVIEPDEEVQGAVGPGQVVPDELLSVRDLDLPLTPEQRRRLAAEEIGAITDEGIRFESILLAGFGLQMAATPDLTAPWVTYALHELGEETRHSRLFVRLLGQLRPRARSPFNTGLLGVVKRAVVGAAIRRPLLLYTLVLAGEEIPDLHQKRSSEHPATDPFLASVSRYHRLEEARHLAFARARLPELAEGATRAQRAAVRRLAPHLVQAQFEGLLHPGIYRAVGLPGWRTWWRVHRSPYVVAFRHEATQPILRELTAAGLVHPRRVPRGWRRLAGVDRTGQPVP